MSEQHTVWKTVLQGNKHLGVSNKKHHMPFCDILMYYSMLKKRFNFEIIIASNKTF